MRQYVGDGPSVFTEVGPCPFLTGIQDKGGGTFADLPNTHIQARGLLN